MIEPARWCDESVCHCSNEFQWEGKVEGEERSYKSVSQFLKEQVDKFRVSHVITADWEWLRIRGECPPQLPTRNVDPHIAEEKPILVVSILCSGPGVMWTLFTAG